MPVLKANLLVFGYVGATLIDTVLILLLFPFTYYNLTQWKNTSLLVPLGIMPNLYKIYCEYRWGATLGKYINNLVVTNEAFEKADFSAIALRNSINLVAIFLTLASFFYAFSQPQFADLHTYLECVALTTKSPFALYSNFLGLIFFIDILFIFKGTQFQTLHDRMGKTFVLRC